MIGLALTHWPTVLVLGLISLASALTFLILARAWWRRRKEEARAGILRSPITGRIIYIPGQRRRR